MAHALCLHELFGPMETFPTEGFHARESAPVRELPGEASVRPA
jgi:hypothetical protein